MRFVTCCRNTMPRKIGPERTYFGGEGGLVTETHLGRTKYYWRCQFCNFTLGGKNFANAKARIHLSGDNALRTGLISAVCPNAPDDVKKKFSDLEREKRQQRQKNYAKKRRAAELLSQKKPKEAGTPPQKQSKLGYRAKATAEEVDKAWGEAFFGLDIAANKINSPLFREAIRMTRKSKPK